MLLLIVSLAHAQVICKGEKIIHPHSFNQCNTGQWLLIFEDDFEGNEVDLEKWRVTETIVREGPEFENGKLWPKKENLEVENGFLSIVAKKEKVLNQCYEIWKDNGYQRYCDDFDHTSGEIESKFKFHYGLVEARIKVPKGKGLWPSFWMYGGGEINGRYINNEIDIFEFRRGNTERHSITIHYDEKMCLKSYNTIDLSKDFHIYSVVWLPNVIEFYVDGNLVRRDPRYYTLHGQEVGCIINEWIPYLANAVFPQHPLGVILGIGIENKEKLRPDATTPFPSYMVVDWVRYYVKSDCNNKTISNNEMIEIIPKTHNTVSAKTVNVNTQFQLNEQEQLSVIASEKINIKGEFVLKASSESKFMIDTLFCNSGYSSVKKLKNTTLPIYTEEISSTEDSFPFILYPNPATDVLNIENLQKTQSKYSVSIYNSNGVEAIAIKEIEINNKSIDVSDLKSGIYVLVIADVLNCNTYKSTFVVK
jgi:beta-glucanase (GH16 family)